MVLEAESDIEIVGEAHDGGSAVAVANELAPDVILMDVRMPGMDGIEATRRIVATQPTARIIILTTFDLDEYAFAGLNAGASGFLLKDAKPAELVAAIRAVASGDAVVSPRITRKLLERFGPQLDPTETNERDERLASLTDRERDVLEQIGRGLSNTEIAALFYLSESTVKTHVGRVFTKLGVRDRVQAVILAYETGVVGRE